MRIDEIGIYMSDEHFSPDGIFTYGSQRLEFYHDDALYRCLEWRQSNKRNKGCVSRSRIRPVEDGSPLVERRRERPG